VLTGKADWSVYANCIGNDGRTPTLFDGLLYVRNPPTAGKENFIVDVATEMETGTFDADVIPAFHGKRGFFLSKATLTARDVPAQTAAWSFKGDGMLTTAPIVVNGNVYIGSTSGMLYALDEKSGDVVWSTDGGNGILAPFETIESPTIAGLAAGGGALIVPAWQHLAAYW
jgi:outer membrane protein assembly factor BamB